MCKNKKRFLDKDTTGSRLGFRVFQRFYELTTISKKPKSIEDFISSSYYTSFVKFGRYLAANDPINTELFVDFVIKNGVKLNDWATDKVYEAFVNDYVKREPVEKALERSVLFITAWCEDKQLPFDSFFNEITTIEAARVIQQGKISPWMLFLAATANSLLAEFNEEQFAMISNVIDPKFWKAKLTKNPDDVAFAKEIIGAANL